MLNILFNKVFKSKHSIDPLNIDFAFNVAKRLDEHRELVEDLLVNSFYLSKPEKHDWRITHLATQDDYLMYLFYLRHGQWPLDQPSLKMAGAGYYRDRPLVLGQCSHPLFVSEHGKVPSFNPSIESNISSRIPFTDIQDSITGPFNAYTSVMSQSISNIIQNCFAQNQQSSNTENRIIVFLGNPDDFIAHAIFLYAEKFLPDTQRHDLFNPHCQDRFQLASSYYHEYIASVKPCPDIEKIIHENTYSPLHLRKVFSQFNLIEFTSLRN